MRVPVECKDHNISRVRLCLVNFGPKQPDMASAIVRCAAPCPSGTQVFVSNWWKIVVINEINFRPLMRASISIEKINVMKYQVLTVATKYCSPRLNVDAH